MMRLLTLILVLSIRPCLAADGDLIISTFEITERNGLPFLRVEGVATAQNNQHVTGLLYFEGDRVDSQVAVVASDSFGFSFGPRAGELPRGLYKVEVYKGSALPEVGAETSQRSAMKAIRLGSLRGWGVSATDPRDRVARVASHYSGVLSTIEGVMGELSERASGQSFDDASFVKEVVTPIYIATRDEFRFLNTFAYPIAPEAEQIARSFLGMLWRYACAFAPVGYDPGSSPLGAFLNDKLPRLYPSNFLSVAATADSLRQLLGLR